MVQKVEMVDWLNTRNWDCAGNSFSASGGWKDPYSRLALAVLTYAKITLGYDVTKFGLPSQKKEGKGGGEPSFASNLILNFRVLIKPY